MLLALGDTHRQVGHGLVDRTLEAVREADVVAHTGDFTTVAVYEALAAECEGLHAVAGNNDEPALADRLPSRTVFEAEGLTVAMVHGHAHSEQSRSLLGRSTGAELVLSGHSHRPNVLPAGACTLLNPGSHADPRWYEPAHAEVERTAEGVEGRLVHPDGTVFQQFQIE